MLPELALYPLAKDGWRAVAPLRLLTRPAEEKRNGAASGDPTSDLDN